MTRSNHFVCHIGFAMLSLLPTGTVMYATPGAAQAVMAGSISGLVLDPDQAAIPGATVTLTPASGTARVVTSGADGGYNFRGVPAGTYSLTVTMRGFASYVRQGLRVQTAPLSLNAALTVQAEATEVNVTTEGNQVSVESESNGSAVVIKDQDLAALSDDPDELSDQLTALAGPSAGPTGGQIYVDGFTGGTLPPKSSIREVRVNRNPFSAQYDKQGFGRVEVFTKPGTDKAHGQFSLQGNTKAFNTSNPFLGAANQQPGYHRIFAIGSLTGPLTKASSYSLAGSYRDIQDNSVFAGQIISSYASSATLCQPGDTTCTLNTYPDTGRATYHPQTRYDFTPRVDVAITPNNTLTARYQFEHNDQTNAGLGSTSLASTAYNTGQRSHQLQLSDTQIYGTRLINETRLAVERVFTSELPVSTAPTLSLTGYFVGGGSNAGTQTSTADHFELQNYTSIALTKNFLRFGVRLRDNRYALASTAGSNGLFTYQSLAAYQSNQPLQYRVTLINNASAAANVWDLGFYAEDDFRIKPNLQLSYGLRYESQNAIHSAHDLAPRVALSYGVPRKGGNPTTVLRAGFGIFYDRFDVSNVVTTVQQNGQNQVTQIFSSPMAGCSPTNTALCGSAGSVSNTVYQLGAGLRSPYTLQTQIGVDQQIGKRTTLSLNYINSDGLHQYFSRSLPAASTGSYTYQFQSGGVFRENQLLTNFRTQLSSRLSFFGFYALSFAKSNANGATTFPTDSLDPRTDYGSALFVNRNRALIIGNWTAPYRVSVNPFFVVNSGSYYNVTTGTDLNGDTVINDRAGFANGNSGDCKNALTFTSAATNTNRVPQGYCTGPSGVEFNLRLSKTFGFGERAGGNQAQQDQGPGTGGPPPGAGGGRPGGGGPGGGPGFGGGSSGRRYSVTLGAQAQNLFNFVPYANPNGALTSYSADPSKNLFGKSTALSSFGPGGSSSAVRSITLQLNFSF